MSALFAMDTSVACAAGPTRSKWVDCWSQLLIEFATKGSELAKAGPLEAAVGAILAAQGLAPPLKKQKQKPQPQQAPPQAGAQLIN